MLLDPGKNRDSLLQPFLKTRMLLELSPKPGIDSWSPAQTRDLFGAVPKSRLCSGGPRGGLWSWEFPQIPPVGSFLWAGTENSRISGNFAPFPPQTPAGAPSQLSRDTPEVTRVTWPGQVRFGAAFDAERWNSSPDLPGAFLSLINFFFTFLC